MRVYAHSHTYEVLYTKSAVDAAALPTTRRCRCSKLLTVSILIFQLVSRSQRAPQSTHTRAHIEYTYIVCTYICLFVCNLPKVLLLFSYCLHIVAVFHLLCLLSRLQTSCEAATSLSSVFHMCMYMC